jgi:acyl carrier protein
MEARVAIRSFIAENFFFSVEGSSFSDSDSFLQEGIVDSLGVMDLVAFVGTTFGIAVAPKDVTPANFDSVEKLAAYIERKRPTPARAEQRCALET